MPEAVSEEHAETARAVCPPGGCVGVVVIGRNEGERLRLCLESVRSAGRWVVYVDSGSVDGSVALAAEMGVEVVQLDPARPFSAARARNEGFERLLAMAPEVELVQFVDGDCELMGDWLRLGSALLGERTDVAIVCGRLRERYPEASVYNRLCDLEFDREPGEVKGCGGIFLCRAGAFREVGGFDARVVAGEEPELCVRLRRAGWKVWRLRDEMAWHDSAMTRFGQWWKRGVRSGLAYAQGAALHGAGPERYCVRECVGIWAWAFCLPLVALGLAWWTRGWSLLVLLAYPIQVWRVRCGWRRPERARGDAWWYALACVGIKWPQWVGQMEFLRRRLLGEAPRIIEHKGVGASTAPVRDVQRVAGSR